MRITNQSRLKDIFKSPLTNGIFSFIYNKYPQMTELFNSIMGDFKNIHALDTEYILNKSGDKKISCLLYALFSRYVVDEDYSFARLHNGQKVRFDSDEFYSEFINDIVINIIAIKFFPKWTNSLKALQTEYNALTPYSTTVDDKLDINRTGTNDSNNTTNDNYVEDTYGYNSDDATPSNSGESGSVTTNNYTSKSDDTHTRHLTRSGNIGNKSSMQLLEEELEFRKNLIVEEIYKDLDTVLIRNHY